MSLPIVVEVTLVGEVEGCPNPPITPPPSLGVGGAQAPPTPPSLGLIGYRLPLLLSAILHRILY